MNQNSLKLAFLVDPLATLNPAKDSSIAMMREAARRGHQVFALSRETLSWQNDDVFAQAQQLELSETDHPWMQRLAQKTSALSSFDAVLMRQDPPFDFEYITATWLLERAVAAGARVFNAPRAIRDHSEKLSITEFSQWAAPSLVTRDTPTLQTFIDDQSDAILKPLDGMGGSQIFRVRRDDPNRNVIIETLTGRGQHTIMAQRYLPEIIEGDKRVLLIGGTVVPYALARIPKAGETRGNLAAGGQALAMPLSAREKHVAEALAPVLWKRGLLIVGLDMIGGYLTEINVTSPTCFIEIEAQTGFNVAAHVLETLEHSGA